MTLSTSPSSSIVPAHPSNRRLLDQLLLWGFKEIRIKGGYVIVEAPNGARIKVRPAHLSVGTSPVAMQECVRYLGVTREEFWARTEPIITPALRSILSPAASPKEPTVAEPALPQQIPGQQTLPFDTKAGDTIAPRRPLFDTVPRPAPARRYHKGCQAAVLDVLSDGKTRHLDQVVSQVSGGWAKASVSGALRALYGKGILERPGHAIYRFPNEASERLPVDASQVQPVRERSPQPKSAAPKADEGVVNDVLDLLFPNGFKARHLPLIERWKVATADLLREIEQ